jgi:6-phosphogluconolactonase
MADISFYDTVEGHAETLAQSIAEQLLHAIEARGHASLILPGGSSPVALITRLAQQEVLWDDVVLGTTDERCVPLSSEHSNAGQIQRLFAAQGVEITPAWMKDPALFSQLPRPADITILGMGLDAHIASIFPKQTAEKEVGIYLAHAPAEPKARLTLAMNSLLDTRRLILLVVGAEKWALCQAILAGEHSDTPLAKLIEKAKENLELHVI